MPRGQTRKGRARASLMAAVSSARPLLKSYDHGEPIAIRAPDVGATGERWVEPFLTARTWPRCGVSISALRFARILSFG